MELDGLAGWKSTNHSPCSCNCHRRVDRRFPGVPKKGGDGSAAGEDGKGHELLVAGEQVIVNNLLFNCSI